MTKEAFYPLRWLKERELGLNKKLSHLDTRTFTAHLYSSLHPAYKWDPKDTVDSTHHGGIFNFDFSPDGSLLAAACEGHSILLFDPFNGKLTAERSKAHTDCVNCVKFLDSRLFATCSDDSTVALWDVRFLKNKLRNLQGHTNWVKNIEYDRNNGLLVTSGFDGNVFTWDINSYSDTETKGNKVFTYKLLMRSKLSPDSTKLVISTQNGYIIVIHDLDLLTLSDDMKGFPHYGIPLSSQFLYRRSKSKRNRVELIRDWPVGDNASDIASLQVHPQGWCVISRNVSRDKKSEWTCIHDLQESLLTSKDSASDFSVMPHTSCCQSASTYTPASASTAPTTIVTSSPRTTTVGTTPMRTRLAPSIIINPTTSESSPVGSVSAPSIVINPPSFSMQGRVGSDNEDSQPEGNVSDSHPAPSVIINSNPAGSEEQGRGFASVTIHITDSGDSPGTASSPRRRVQVLDFHTRPSNSIYTQGEFNTVRFDQQDAALSASRFESRLSIPLIHHPRDDLESLLHDDLSSDSSDDDSDDDLLSSNFEPDLEDLRIVRDNRAQAQHYQDSVDLYVRYRYDGNRGIIDVNHRVRVGQPSYDNGFVKTHGRLLYYTEEPNIARGFIKELCFSADGRLVCSPFAFGVRLLSFNPECQELCDVVPSIPMRLYELGTCLSHSNVVVTCKFSPTHCMFVSGCLNGKVVFHQPVL